MSKSIFIKLILILLVATQSLSAQNGSEEAIRMLRDFYSAYITEQCKIRDIDLQAIATLKQKYLTERLLNKIEAARLDYDPFLKAQDCEMSWINSLEISHAEHANSFKVCYRYNEEWMKCTTLSLIERQGKFMIDDIPDVIENAHAMAAFTETFNEEDIEHEYLSEQLKPIRENFKRLNSTTNWDKIYEISSPNGDKVKYYYTGNRLQKIAESRENGLKMTEYYLLNEQLSFVLERHYSIEDNDIQVVICRNYFKNGKLLHQLHSGDCGAPFAKDYLLAEQKRILSDFEAVAR